MQRSVFAKEGRKKNKSTNVPEGKAQERRWAFTCSSLSLVIERLWRRSTLKVKFTLEISEPCNEAARGFFFFSPNGELDDKLAPRIDFREHWFCELCVIYDVNTHTRTCTPFRSVLQFDFAICPQENEKKTNLNLSRNNCRLAFFFVWHGRSRLKGVGGRNVI